MNYKSVVLGLMCYSASLMADVRDNTTGVTFPSEVSFKHDGTTYNLKATGVSTRKKFFVKVYSVASYLQDSAFGKGNRLEAILSDDNAKQLTVRWVRRAPLDKMLAGYHESFQKAMTKEQYRAMQKEVEKYLSFFKHEIEDRDEHILRWIPGGIVTVTINGEEMGSVQNKEFAKELWDIWFGTKSVVNRNQLLSSSYTKPNK